MIIYKELSSLVKDLKLSPGALYAASNTASKHYRKSYISKGNGEFRELSVPDDFMKAVQHKIVNVLLLKEEISPYATAYRFGGSPLVNARVHLGKKKVLKLDIRHFFDNIIYPLVKDKVFPAERYSEKNRILLTLICMYKDSLPQGAPTSPVISNIIMREFDNTVGEYCRSKNIAYTRYCDDMTFSGDFDEKPVIEFVKNELKKMGFFINSKKTVVAEDGQRKAVTGVIVNEKLNVAVSYRRKIRQEIYYIKKFGLESHMKKCGISIRHNYLNKLMGRINYVLSIDGNNEEMKEYKKLVRSLLKDRIIV